MELKDIFQDEGLGDEGLGEDDERWCATLADWLEANPPSLEDAQPLFEFFLQSARDTVSETATAECVAVALARGASWAQVAEALSTSEAEARHRFPGADSAALAESARWAGHTSTLAATAASESSDWADLLASVASEAETLHAEMSVAFGPQAEAG